MTFEQIKAMWVELYDPIHPNKLSRSEQDQLYKSRNIYNNYSSCSLEQLLESKDLIEYIPKLSPKMADDKDYIILTSILNKVIEEKRSAG